MTNVLSAFGRGVAIAVMVAVLVVVPHAARGSHTAGFTYTIEQGGVETVVTPMLGADNVINFYNYHSSSAHTGLETSNTSLLFLYEDNDGNLSLVMIHDKPDDNSGGTVTFNFSGIPDGTTFAVEDDPQSVNNTDSFGAITSGSATVAWNWFDCCTDGGALSGTLTEQEFAITITPDFSAGINTWKFLSPDSSNAITLDRTKSITVRARRSVVPVTIDIKPGDETNCFNNDGHGVIPVAILSSATFDATQVNPTTVTLDGQGVRVVGKGNLQSHVEDVNQDGINDLVVQIEDQDGTYTEGETAATLTGYLYDGTPIQGTDSICIVP